MGRSPYDIRLMTRVLLVEDEARIASFVSRALTAEGMTVDTAADGIRGLSLAQTRHYDLVILDLLLPGKDGFTVLSSIMEQNPSQRVLVLSALGDVDAKVRCFEGGAADYLPKPFSLAELVARIRARLREPAVDQQLNRVLNLGAVRLDLVRRIANSGASWLPCPSVNSCCYRRSCVRKATCARECNCSKMYGATRLTQAATSWMSMSAGSGANSDPKPSRR